MWRRLVHTFYLGQGPTALQLTLCSALRLRHYNIAGPRSRLEDIQESCLSHQAQHRYEDHHKCCHRPDLANEMVSLSNPQLVPAK